MSILDGNLFLVSEITIIYILLIYLLKFIASNFRLISNIADKKMKFSIDRSSENCRTPRRNPEIEAALDYFYVSLKSLFMIFK